MYERFRAEKIKALSMAENAVCPLSFYIFRGEVLGVLGMDGMERNSLIRILSGQEKMLQGRMWIDGEEIKISSVYDGQKKGIYLINQESRLFPQRSIEENFILMLFRKIILMIISLLLMCRLQVLIVLVLLKQELNLITLEEAAFPQEAEVLVPLVVASVVAGVARG